MIVFGNWLSRRSDQMNVPLIFKIEQLLRIIRWLELRKGTMRISSYFFFWSAHSPILTRWRPLWYSIWPWIFSQILCRYVPLGSLPSPHNPSESDRHLAEFSQLISKRYSFTSAAYIQSHSQTQSLAPHSAHVQCMRLCLKSSMSQASAAN